MAHERPHRQPGEMEVGITDVFLPHEIPKPHTQVEVPAWLTTWETHRPKWLMELVAEFFGVMLYCWCGMGATACFLVTGAAKEEGFGSLLNIAFAYTFAIVLAVTLIGPTSGGHLHPAMTISFAVFKGFPWRKVLPYITAQVTGGFVGGVLVYAQYAPALHAMTVQMEAAGLHDEIFTPSGPAGAIALFLAPGTEIGIVLVNEFVSTIFIAVAVFSVLDPSNIFISPSSAPVVIGLVFFVCIICWSPNGIALNTARDLGGRLAAACFWGRGAFPSRYTALACLTNILGTLIGASFQTLFLSDTVRPPTAGAMSMHHSQTVEKEAHLQRTLTARGNESTLGRVLSGNLGRKPTFDGRGEVTHIEEKSMA